MTEPRRRGGQKRRYQVGDVVNGHVVIDFRSERQFNGLNYKIECQACGHQRAWSHATTVDKPCWECRRKNELAPYFCEVCETTDPDLFRKLKCRCMACDRTWYRYRKKGYSWDAFVKARRDYYMRLATRWGK